MALVGLTQLAVWTVVMGILATVAGTVMGVNLLATSPNLPADAMAEVQNSGFDISGVLKAVMSVNYGQIFTCFLLYFIGGFCSMQRCSLPLARQWTRPAMPRSSPRPSS